MTIVECLTGSQVNFMATILVVGVVLTLWVLWRVQRSPKQIDFVDLMIEPDTGRASWTKITAMGAFLISSWGFVALINHDHMTEMLFFFYVAVYSSAPVAYKFMASRMPPQPPEPQQTVTVNAPAGQEVKMEIKDSPASGAQA